MLKGENREGSGVAGETVVTSTYMVLFSSLSSLSHEGVQVDDLPPQGTYYGYAYKHEKTTN